MQQSDGGSGRPRGRERVVPGTRGGARNPTPEQVRRGLPPLPRPGPLPPSGYELANPVAQPTPVQQWVVDRQKVLKGLGFVSVVDGVWGPRSQAAWKRFMASLGQTEPGLGMKGADYTPAAGRPLPADTIAGFKLTHPGVRRTPGFINPLPFTEGMMKAGTRHPALPRELQIQIARANIRGGRVPEGNDEVAMQRDEENQRLARRSPLLARALFPSRAGPALGLKSVPWTNPEVTRALQPEDILRLLQDDIRQKAGPRIFGSMVLPPGVKRKPGNMIWRPNRLGTTLVNNWLRSHGVRPEGRLDDWDEKTGLGIEKMARIALRFERRRHVANVKKGLYDTGLIQGAFEQAGMPALKPAELATLIQNGHDLRIPRLLQIAAEIGTEKMLRKEWGEYRDAIIRAAGITDLATLGGNPLGLRAINVPRSITMADSTQEFEAARAVEERKIVEAQLAASMEKMRIRFATAMQEELGDARYQPITVEMRLADGTVVPYNVNPALIAPDDPEQSDAANARRWDELVGPELVAGTRGGADRDTAALRAAADYAQRETPGVLDYIGQGLEWSGEPAIFTVDRVLGLGAYALAGATLGATASVEMAQRFVRGQPDGLLYVTAAERHNVLDPYRVEALDFTRTMSLMEAIEQGNTYRDELPWGTAFMLEFALDPLNLVGMGFIARPLQAVRRLAGNVSVVKRLNRELAAVETSRVNWFQAKHGRMPASAHDRWVNGNSRMFKTIRQTQDEIDGALHRARMTLFKGYRLSVANEMERMRLLREAFDYFATSPEFGRMFSSALRHGASVYWDERGTLSQFGGQLQGMLLRYHQERAVHVLAERYPKKQIDTAQAYIYATGSIDPDLIEEFESIIEVSKALVSEQVLPLIQHYMVRNHAVTFGEDGLWVMPQTAQRYERAMKTFAAIAFEDKVKVVSPNFGRMHTAAQKDAAIAFEVDWRVSRAIARDKSHHSRIAFWNEPEYEEGRKAFSMAARREAERDARGRFIHNNGSLLRMLEDVRRMEEQETARLLNLEDALAVQVSQAELVEEVLGAYAHLQRLSGNRGFSYGHLGVDVAGKKEGRRATKLTTGRLVQRWRATEAGKHPYTREQALAKLHELEREIARQQTETSEPDWARLAAAARELEVGAFKRYAIADKGVLVRNPRAVRAGGGGGAEDVAPVVVRTQERVQQATEQAANDLWEADLTKVGLLDQSLPTAQETSDKWRKQVDRILHQREVGDWNEGLQKMEKALSWALFNNASIAHLYSDFDEAQQAFVEADDAYRAAVEKGPKAAAEQRETRQEWEAVRAEQRQTARQFFQAMAMNADPVPFREAALHIAKARLGLIEKGNEVKARLVVLEETAAAGGPEAGAAFAEIARLRVWQEDIARVDELLRLRQERFDQVRGAGELRTAGRSAERDVVAGMRSELQESRRQAALLSESIDRTRSQVEHLQSIDQAAILRQAVKGASGDGWIDLRTHVEVPRMHASVREGPIAKAALHADQYESFAQFLNDPEMISWAERVDAEVLAQMSPMERLQLPDPKPTVTALIRQPTLQEPRPTIAPGAGALGPTPTLAAAGLAPRVTDEVRSSPYDLGSAEFRTPVTRASGESGVIDPTVKEYGLQEATTDAIRQQRTGSTSPGRLGMILKQMEMNDKVAFDHVRYTELKLRGRWLASLKYAESIPMRATYLTFVAMTRFLKTSWMPLSPGWVMLNYFDNTAKTLVEGNLDPRMWINPSGKSFAEWAPMTWVRYVAKQFDDLFGSNLAGIFDHLLYGFWSQPPKVLTKIWGAHGIEYPAELMDGSVMQSLRVTGDEGLAVPAGDVKEALRRAKARGAEAEQFFKLADHYRESDPNLAWRYAERAHKAADDKRKLVGRAFTDGIWQVTADIGEGNFRRANYAAFYRKELQNQRRLYPEGSLADAEAEAARVALERVNRVFFTPDTKTTLEENLGVIWIFAHFARSNAVYWSTKLAKDPWLLAGMDRINTMQAENTPDGQPSWMERYVSTAFLSNVPVIGKALESTLFKDGYFDPRNLVSVNLLFRTFKEQNALLTEEQGGIAFLNALVDMTNDVGLGLAPWIRKPLEMSGLISPQFWRDVLPQTTILQALDVEWQNKRWPDGLNLESILFDPAYKAFLDVDLTDARQADYEALVARELSGMILRDEVDPLTGLPDREVAEDKIDDWMVVRTITSWASHVYIRRITPEDIATYRLAEDMHDNPKGDIYLGLSAKEQQAYQVFKNRGQTLGALDRWMEIHPRLQGYWARPYNMRDEYLAENPELVAFVRPGARVTTVDADGRTRYEVQKIRAEQRKQTQLLVAQTEILQRFTEALETDPGDWGTYMDELYGYFVTPTMEAFWARNDTSTDLQRTMVKLEFDGVVDRLNKTFFAIPEKDYEARAEFLRQHPLLVSVWRRGGVRMENGVPQPGAMAGDLLSINKLVRAHFRDFYFALKDAEGWDAAAEFLAQHSDIMRGTKSAKNVSEIGPDAFWVPGGVDSFQGKFYIRVKPWLDLYFSQDGNKEAMRQVGREHPEIYDYFDYIRTLPDKKGGGKGKRNYSSGDRRFSVHARDYKAVKPLLEAYFALPKDQRTAYAEAHPQLLDYFKKYGESHTRTRRGRRRRWGHWSSAVGKMGADYLHTVQRVEFWLKFYELAPDEREAYVRAQAAAHGVFVYGYLGGQEIWDNEQYALAYQFAHGTLTRASAYALARPFLDIYFSLPEESRAFFAETNPEVAFYLRLYTKKRSLSGDEATDKLIAEFFKIPDYQVEDREKFLEEHPEVGVYFDARRTPEERALQKLVEHFFAKVPFDGREGWLNRHPEVRHYFELREAQNLIVEGLGEAFDETDPRLKPFAMEAGRTGMYAEMVFNMLQQQRLTEDVELETPRGRVKEKRLRERGRQPDANV